MTRVNTIRPAFLSDAHLGAEYREIARIPALVRQAIARGERPDLSGRYTMGSGHVRFFYPRLGYVVRRYADLVNECRARGRKVTFPELDVSGIGSEWFGEWAPDAHAHALNVDRIIFRGGLRKSRQIERKSNGRKPRRASSESERPSRTRASTKRNPTRVGHQSNGHSHKPEAHREAEHRRLRHQIPGAGFRGEKRSSLPCSRIPVIRQVAPE